MTFRSVVTCITVHYSLDGVLETIILLVMFFYLSFLNLLISFGASKFHKQGFTVRGFFLCHFCVWLSFMHPFWPLYCSISCPLKIARSFAELVLQNVLLIHCKDP